MVSGTEEIRGEREREAGKFLHCYWRNLSLSSSLTMISFMGKCISSWKEFNSLFGSSTLKFLVTSEGQ